MTTPVGSRVAALPDLPKMVAVNRLATSLDDRGLHSHAAAAIAVSVCDPTTVRRQLAAPGRLRVDGGYLEVVQTEIWTPAVLAYPTNPRALPAFAYEIEGETGRRTPLPPLEGSADPEAVEVVVPGVRSADLVGALDAQVEYLRRANDLRETVGQLGIREPLLLVPLIIDLRSEGANNDVDSAESPAMLAAVDGSSRITAAHAHLGIDPGESLFEYLGRDRALRQKIGTFLKLTHRTGGLTDEELAQCMSLVAPATIIVGFVPDDPESDTLLAAINSRLGALHVDPPKAWSAASRLDVQLDVALHALVGGGHLDPDEAEWLSGRITVDEATGLGFREHPDIRAGYLFETIGHSDSVSGKALRALTARSRITANLRAEIAAEGAIRGYRSQVSDTQAQAARSLLTAIYMMDEVQGSWTVDPYGEPESAQSIRDEAWKELRDLGGPGPTARLLLVLAAYWLARMRVVPRQTRGGQDDRRDITTVLSLMAKDKRGIRQFIQIIQDGRKGRFPRQVGRTGKMLATSERLTDTWIRETWSTGKGSAGKRPAATPEAQLNEAAGEVRTTITELKTRIEALKEPKIGDGGPLVDTNGLDTELVTAMLADLVEVQMRLSVLKHIGETHAASFAGDDNGDELDDE
jgi:hypothetical protein